MTIPFKTASIRYLKEVNRHPETKGLADNFSRLTKRGILGEEYGVLTHKGEVLGFIVKDLPNGFLIRRFTSNSFNKSISIKRIREWQEFDCVSLRYKGRFAFWFVPPKHEDLLPIPKLD